jgi:hypothetical protein
LPKGVRGLVVSSGIDGAHETVLHLQETLPGSWEASPIEGFSALVGEDEVLRSVLQDQQSQ